MLQLRTLVVTCCLVAFTLWGSASTKQVLQRKHFVLGSHVPNETVLEMVGSTASWYDDHPVELEIQYPMVAGSDYNVRLSCVDVVIIYGTSQSARMTDGTIGATGNLRVQFVSGGLGEPFAIVSVLATEVTYFNHTTIFYGFRR